MAVAISVPVEVRPSLNPDSLFLVDNAYFDLIFTFQTMHREIRLSADKSELIENHLKDYYERHPDSKIKPQILCVVLIHFFSRHIGSIGIHRICKIFKIDYSWFRRVRRDYLQRLEVFEPELEKQYPFGQSYYNEWRSPVIIGLATEA